MLALLLPNPRKMYRPINYASYIDKILMCTEGLTLVLLLYSLMLSGEGNQQ
jgi:hypothetical protein